MNESARCRSASRGRFTKKLSEFLKECVKYIDKKNIFAIIIRYVDGTCLWRRGRRNCKRLTEKRKAEYAPLAQLDRALVYGTKG